MKKPLVIDPGDSSLIIKKIVNEAKGFSRQATFARHETFPFRFWWLKKGFDAVEKDHTIFKDEKAMVHLGVGKNMVRSMRYWMLATGLARADGDSRREGMPLRPSEWGKKLFSENGWDPFLEDPASLWLIHWHLATNETYATTWYWAFSIFGKTEFTVESLTRDLSNYVHNRLALNVSSQSLQNDVQCLVRMYLPSEESRRRAEDILDCPLSELGLLTALNGQRSYRFRIGAKRSLPLPVFAYVLSNFVNQRQTQTKTVTLEELVYEPGCPGRVYKLDLETCVASVERVTESYPEFFDFDETAGLRQLYIRKEMDPLNFLAEHYEGL